MLSPVVGGLTFGVDKKIKPSIKEFSHRLHIPDAVTDVILDKGPGIISDKTEWALDKAFPVETTEGIDPSKMSAATKFAIFKDLLEIGSIYAKTYSKQVHANPDHPYTPPWMDSLFAPREQVGSLALKLAPNKPTWYAIKGGLIIDEKVQKFTKKWQKKSGIDLRSMPALWVSAFNKARHHSYYKTKPAIKGSMPKPSFSFKKSKVRSPKLDPKRLFKQEVNFINAPTPTMDWSKTNIHLPQFDSNGHVVKSTDRHLGANPLGINSVQRGTIGEGRFQENLSIESLIKRQAPACPWLASLMHAPCAGRCPKSEGAFGSTVVHQKQVFEVNTDANGDARGIISSFSKFAGTTVDPTTGVHTPLALPDDATISSRFERVRSTHTSAKFTYIGDVDDANGYVAVAMTRGDQNLATWNEDGDVLSRHLHSQSFNIYDGFYAYISHDPNHVAEMTSELLTAASTAAAGVATGQYSFIKFAISGAAPSTTVGRITIQQTYEGYSEDQLWDMYRVPPPTKNVFKQAYRALAGLNIPFIFKGSDSEQMIHEYMKKAAVWVGKEALDAAGSGMGVSGVLGLLRAGMSGDVGALTESFTNPRKRTKRY